MVQLDCLLVHTPKFDNYYKPIGHFTWVNYMPVGMLGLADHLETGGCRARILHQGVEWMNDRSWRLEDTLATVDAPLVALSLHWHQQAYDVIETCRRIRAVRPQAYIALGGFTASFFHDELVRDYDCVDGVICGDAEVPLLELTLRLKAGTRELGDVPNLTWRNARGEVVQNGVSYCGTAEMLDRLCFSNMELLCNYRAYVDYVTFPFVVVKHISKESNFRRVGIGRKLFPLTLGRGCPLNCTWCAGSFESQKKISCRDRVARRSHDAVLADVRRAIDYGYEAMYSVFDPTPQPQGQDYFVELFRRLREEGLAKKVGWMHEATGLACGEFIDAFAETVAEDFRVLAVSPESGNEEVRRRNKGYFYSNDQLHEMLDHAVRRGIQAEVFFSCGIPGENEESLRDTIRLRDEIQRRHGRKVRVRTMSIEMEPGAPWHVEPEKHGIVTSLKAFRDFYTAHSRSGASSYTGLGYYVPDYFKAPLDAGDPEADFARRLQQLKCKHFCLIHPRPFWGRMLCRTLRTVRLLARRDRRHSPD